MREISSFFGKIQNLYKKESKTSSSLVDILKKYGGITLPSDSLKVKEGVLIVTTNTYIKSQLFIKKQKLLNAFKEFAPELNIRDIA